MNGRRDDVGCSKQVLWGSSIYIIHQKHKLVLRSIIYINYQKTTGDVKYHLYNSSTTPGDVESIIYIINQEHQDTEIGGELRSPSPPDKAQDDDGK